MPQHSQCFDPAVGAAMTVSGNIQTPQHPELVPNIREHVAYVKWSAAAAAGTVLVESAHDPTYAGTWKLVGTMNFVANALTSLNFTGYHRALRLRCSADVTAGNAVGYFGGN